MLRQEIKSRLMHTVITNGSMMHAVSVMLKNLRSQRVQMIQCEGQKLDPFLMHCHQVLTNQIGAHRIYRHHTWLNSQLSCTLNMIQTRQDCLQVDTREMILLAIFLTSDAVDILETHQALARTLKSLDLTLGWIEWSEGLVEGLCMIQTVICLSKAAKTQATFQIRWMNGKKCKCKTCKD